MEISTEEMAKKCMDLINSKIKNLKKINIIVIGKSGVGKSTLINNLFKENFAETGIGRPVTASIRKIERQDYPLAIYDTPGFELSNKQQKNVQEEIFDIIEKGEQTRDINDCIHCIWYCVNVQGNRTFDSEEIEWIKKLTEKVKIPVIVILTQAVPKNKAQQMKRLIENENLAIRKVVPVLSADMNFDDEYMATSYGLDVLVDVLGEILPIELQDTLQNLQKASLESKKKYAHAVVATAATTAFGEGFVPIPFSDAAILVPTQMSMIAGITVAFGLNINKSVLTGLISSTIGTSGTTVLGKTLVSNLLKVIPGVGTGIGGMISGTTAATLTIALGEAYIKLMEMMYKGELNKDALCTTEGQNTMQELFKLELKKSR